MESRASNGAEEDAVKPIGGFILVMAMCLMSCRRETPPPPSSPPPTPAATTIAGEPTDLTGKKVDRLFPVMPPVASKCLAGTKRADDGTIAEAVSEIAATEPLGFTMWLNQSPDGLQVAMVARNQSGDEVARVSRPAGGAKVVTMELTQPLPKGTYTIEGYWGGNIACEQPLTVN